MHLMCNCRLQRPYGMHAAIILCAPDSLGMGKDENVRLLMRRRSPEFAANAGPN